MNDEDKYFFEICTNVPKVSKMVSIICLILNLILPGSGTLLAACVAQTETVSKGQLCLAFFQLITAFILIGFIFALIWSVLIVKKAWVDKNLASEQGEKDPSWKKVLKSATREKPKEAAEINMEGFNAREARKQWGNIKNTPQTYEAEL